MVVGRDVGLIGSFTLVTHRRLCVSENQSEDGLTTNESAKKKKRARHAVLLEVEESECKPDACFAHQTICSAPQNPFSLSEGLRTTCPVFASKEE